MSSCRTGFPDLVEVAQALARKLRDGGTQASHNVENLMLSATMDMIGEILLCQRTVSTGRVNLTRSNV